MANITLKNIHTAGPIYTTVKNDTVIANCDGVLTIADCVFDGDQYNTIFTNWNANGQFPTPHTVNIKNCAFKGKTANNSISVYALQDGGTINVKNCTFTDCSNPFRFMNAGNNKNITINLEDCVCEKWESRADDFYGQCCGFIIFEDPVNTDYAEKNLFGVDAEGAHKITVNIKNCIGPDGKKILDMSGVASHDLNQTVYISYDKAKKSTTEEGKMKYRAMFPDYSESIFPKFNFS